MLAIAVVAGGFIGLSLGALGGGGSILAVPVLVYLLGQTPVAATTGSLLIVGVSSLTGAVAAWRAGNVDLVRGLAFGATGIAGAALGAMLSVHVDPTLLLALFACLMLVVAAVMAVRQLRSRDTPGPGRGPRLEEPIVRVGPSFMCNCPVAAKILVTGSAVGVMTGFFGVGGGFLVVPALVLALRLPMPVAAGTSLAVITINSAAALVTRVTGGARPDWTPVLALTAAAILGSLLGARLPNRVDPRKLSGAFSVLLVVVAVYTAAQSFPSLVA